MGYGKAFTIGSAIGAIGWLGSVALFLHQARKAQGNIPLSFDPPPVVEGTYGRRSVRPENREITIAVLGDSLAAGLGATKATETPAGLIAKYVSRILRCRVTVHRFALVSARSPELGLQVHRAKKVRPDLAIIIIGGNDVTHSIHPKISTKHLMDAVANLQSDGTQVIVGTCPDLSSVLTLPSPLKWLAKERSVLLAEGQKKVVESAGGIALPLTDLLVNEFKGKLDIMLGPDKFHPSPKGYETLIRAVLPTITNELRRLSQA